MSGEYEVRAEHLKAYRAHLAELTAQFEEVRFHWVPREENQRADELSKAAFHAEAPSLRRRPPDAEPAEPDDPESAERGGPAEASGRAGQSQRTV